MEDSRCWRLMSFCSHEDSRRNEGSVDLLSAAPNQSILNQSYVFWQKVFLLSLLFIFLEVSFKASSEAMNPRESSY